MNPQHQQKRIIRQSCRHKFYPQPLFNFSYKRPTFAFTGESGYTLAFRRKIAHKFTHGETGAFQMGALLLPSDRFARFGNPAWPGLKTANFAAFGSWSGALPKNAESLRSSDALMRVAAPRRRGPAGLRNSAALASIRFEGGTSGGSGDRREHVPAPDRADIGLAAAHLPTEIGDGIRHDLQGVRAVPAPHGGKQIFLG